MSTTTPSGADCNFGQNPRQAVFATTHWSVVKSAGQNDTTRSQTALAHLCEVYWYPLYAYVRYRGYSPEDAEDLTQEFFVQLLQKGTLTRADPVRGRFRSFLLASLGHFLAHEWEKSRALKRGGAQKMVSLDVATAEQWYALELSDQCTPDKAFEKRWAMALLRQVLDRLESEYSQQGRQELFAVLKETIAGIKDGQSNAELGSRLNMTEGAVKVAVHRLRKRYRELLQTEIAGTVGTPDEAGEELRHLFDALR
jgi:RNA polymerase sigma-70 factor (ECF subfamily)